ALPHPIIDLYCPFRRRPAEGGLRSPAGRGLPGARRLMHSEQPADSFARLRAGLRDARVQALAAGAFAALVRARLEGTGGSASYACVGPGAGIALAGSVFAILLAILMAFLAILTLPFKVVMQFIRGRKAFARARV